MHFIIDVVVLTRTFSICFDLLTNITTTTTVFTVLQIQASGSYQAFGLAKGSSVVKTVSCFETFVCKYTTTQRHDP